MKIAVPRAGSLPYMAEELAGRIGLDYIEAPQYSDNSIREGVSMSPEFFCFPMKVLLGNAAEALEEGADTLVTVAGFGPCRFSYFAEMQKRILERKGYDFKMIVFDSPRDSLKSFFHNMRELKPDNGINLPGMIREASMALRKGWLYDEIEKRAMALRGIEAEEGETDKAVRDALAILAGASSKREIEAAAREIRDRFQRLPVESGRPHIKIGLVGEILTVLEPYFNFNAVKWLAKNGAVMERSVHISDIFTPLGRNPVYGLTDGEILHAAKPYLCHEVGGHGLLSVGAAALFARRRFDAIIHFHPFTCMPEVIARTIFVRISKEFDVPILSISIDEQTGRAGTETRLEALMELVWARKERLLLKQGKKLGTPLHKCGKAPGVSTSSAGKMRVRDV